MHLQNNIDHKIIVVDIQIFQRKQHSATTYACTYFSTSYRPVRLRDLDRDHSQVEVDLHTQGRESE